jgi:hypothetical protein
LDLPIILKLLEKDLHLHYKSFAHASQTASPFYLQVCLHVSAVVLQACPARELLQDAMPRHAFATLRGQVLHAINPTLGLALLSTTPRRVVKRAQLSGEQEWPTRRAWVTFGIPRRPGHWSSDPCEKVGGPLKVVHKVH